MLNVRKACKQFGAKTILDNLSFRMQKNHVLGLAGPSGSGKSTLLRCIQGFEHLDTGTVEIKGTTGFMFQDFQLFPHMTVLDNLIYAAQLQQADADHTTKAMRLLAQLGIEEDASSRHPCQLSGGQKQRVALARALMMKPNCLLCDEPTSGLDVASVGEVVALLRSVMQPGVSILIASHDLDFLTQIADRILLLKAGTIAVDMPMDGQADPVEALKAYY